MPQSFQGNQNEQNSHMLNIFAERHLLIHLLYCVTQGLSGRVGVKYCTWYLYLSTYLSVLDVLEYRVYGNVKVLGLDQKVLGT